MEAVKELRLELKRRRAAMVGTRLLQGHEDDGRASLEVQRRLHGGREDVDKQSPL